MMRTFLGVTLLLACSFAVQAAVCSHEMLESAASSYISAQKAGNPALMNLAQNTIYSENLKSKPIDRSILTNALPVAFQRSFFDVDSCRTYSEVIVTQADQPYVLGVRLTVSNGLITEIQNIVTRKGDWKFDADNSLKYSSAEDWHVLSPGERLSRQALIDGANAYMDRFTTPSTKVAWGIPCARLEGGEYTGDGPRSTCKVGIPLDKIEIVDRSYVVDVNMGTVNIFSHFGKTKADSRYGETDGLPDSHTIRFVDGKIRYVHSMSVVGE